MTAKTTTKPCTCSLIVIVAKDGSTRTTGCKATTKRVFAPGHDARLKGFLIRAGIAEDLVQVGDDTTNREPQAVAEQFGFGYMVLDGIKRGKDALLAKLLGETKTRKIPAPRKPVVVTAKVGRWEYTGTEADGVFSYTDKRGNALTTTKYTKA